MQTHSVHEAHRIVMARAATGSKTCFQRSVAHRLRLRMRQILTPRSRKTDLILY
jgi:hypothetical protein